MKRRVSGLTIAIVLVVLVIAWGVTTNNRMVRLDENVKQSFSNVQTALQRRADLIPNYVKTVKGYAEHEEKVLIEVTEARAKLNDAIEKSTPENPNVKEINEANGKLSFALNAVVERYPELKANENFMALQDELAGTENRIRKARSDYNEYVGTFNKARRTFPTSIIAGMLGFDEKEYFEADPGSQNVPEVDFND